MRNIIRNIVGANLRVRPMSGSNCIAFAQNSVRIAVILLIMTIFAGCDESKRFEISGNDSTPPGKPVFIDSKPLNGGARIFFRPPADEDLLEIEASYLNAAGKRIRFSVSYFTDSLDVYGFGSEGDHQIDLCAIDRAGNRSENVRETVVSLEPAVVAVAKSVRVLPSFASMLVKWDDFLQESVYVSIDYTYTQNGVRHEYTRIFATWQSETRIIEDLMLTQGEQVSVKVSIKDKYDNEMAAKDTAIVLLTDEAISKQQWSLLPQDVIMDGVSQAIGLNMEMVYDGLYEIDVYTNRFITTMANPWNIIIDLGGEYELSRIVTHQQWSGYQAGGVLQGNLFRGDNVLIYYLYGWDETEMSWELLTHVTIDPPVVTDASEYTAIGQAGDMFYLYPDEPRFSKPTRWIRYEAANGKYISEITLFGRRELK